MPSDSDVNDPLDLARVSGIIVGLAVAVAFTYSAIWLAIVINLHEPATSTIPMQLKMLGGSVLLFAAMLITWKCIDRPRYPMLTAFLEGWRIPGFAISAGWYIAAALSGNESSAPTWEKKQPNTAAPPVMPKSSADATTHVAPTATTNAHQPGKGWAVAAHLAFLLNQILPTSGLVASIIIFRSHRNDNDYVRGNAVGALNFHITVTIFELLAVVGIVASGTTFGILRDYGALTPDIERVLVYTNYGLFFGVLAMILLASLCGIVGAIIASKGRVVRYFGAVRFVR